eukprot:216755-Chlamydomonas_euryale.AAC.4
MAIRARPFPPRGRRAGTRPLVLIMHRNHATPATSRRRVEGLIHETDKRRPNLSPRAARVTHKSGQVIEGRTTLAWNCAFVPLTKPSPGKASQVPAQNTLTGARVKRPTPGDPFLRHCTTRWHARCAGKRYLRCRRCAAAFSAATSWQQDRGTAAPSARLLLGK